MKEIMSNLGENYEYLRIIVNRQLEIKKLDLIEDTSKILSTGALFMIFLMLFIMILTCLSTIVIISLSATLGSITKALLAFIGVIVFIGIILYAFRKTLVTTPVSNLFFFMVKNRI